VSSLTIILKIILEEKTKAHHDVINKTECKSLTVDQIHKQQCPQIVLEGMRSDLSLATLQSFHHPGDH